MNMKNYTKIPNEIFAESQLSIRARFLYCTLLKYCGKNDSCFPGQATLAKVMGFSDRYVRRIIDELIRAKLVVVKRSGFNKSNTYKVSKDLYRNNGSGPSGTERNYRSSHIGSAVPLHAGADIPTKSTYIKEKDKNYKNSLKAMEKCKQELLRKGFKVRNDSKHSGGGSLRGGGV